MIVPAHARRCVVSAIVLACFGCGDETAYEVVPVSGTIRFADGTVPTGEFATVSFHPDPVRLSDGTFEAQPLATGELQEDGSFRLSTSGRYGAVAGHHKVVLTVVSKFPGDPSTSSLTVAPKYSSVQGTTLEVEVTAGANLFELTVEKPKKTGIAEHGRVKGAAE